MLTVAALLLVLSSSVAVVNASHFTKRIDAMNAKSSGDRHTTLHAGAVDIDQGASSFAYKPDYNKRMHEVSHELPNQLGGKTTVTHKFAVSGLCRSIDHEDAIESISCDPAEGRALHVKLHANTQLPSSWQPDTVLIGSAEWKCSHAGAPTGEFGTTAKMVMDSYEPMVRRILAIERVDESAYIIHTVPELATVCLDHATVSFRNHMPEHMTMEQYMTAFEEIVVQHEQRRKRAAAANDTIDPDDIVDYHRQFNLASVDVNYNRWAESGNSAAYNAVTYAADLSGFRLRCLECWLKLAVGVDITIKGHRVQPSSEWQWQLWRVKAFGRLSMALHVSVDIWDGAIRPELFVRASLLRMIDFSGDYFSMPHGRFPVLAYLGITLLSVQIKLDLTAMIRVGLDAKFRFNTGFRVNNASVEFGLEKIGDGSPQMIRSANFDGELIPFDLVMNNGSQAYASATFGPHLLAWPWITGSGAVQSALNWVSKYTKTPVSIPLFVLNVNPSVGITADFGYNHTQKCVVASTTLGLNLWLWYEIASLAKPISTLTSPNRGITAGFRVNTYTQVKLWNLPLGTPQCLFSLDLGGLGVGAACDNAEVKCKERCQGRITEKRPVSTVSVCHCSQGALVQQCSDEEQPFIVYPDDGIGAVSGMQPMGDKAFEAAPRINVAEQEPICNTLLTCEACAQQRQCGWCGSVERCMAGDADQKPPACFSEDWLYDTCFRDPKIAISNIPAGTTWRAGDSVPIMWTSRLDVPVSRVGIAYRWDSKAEWVLAAVTTNTKQYTLKLPDGLPTTSTFQVMVQALPETTALGEANAASLPMTPDRLAKFGNAYSTSPVVSVQGPLPCAGINNEQGSCVSPASCTSVGGTLLYKGRRNERQGCDQGQLVNSDLQCCSTGKKRSVAAPRIVVGMYGACPPCGPADLKAVRPVFCLEGGAEPRLLTGPSDKCADLPLPAFETACGTLPVCELLPMQFVRPGPQFTPESHIAIAGQPFNVAWEGGRLDLNAELQVLLGANCGSGDIANMPWKTVATSPAFTGNNALSWDVPADFVQAGAPQWTRLRVLLDGKYSALSTSVLIAQVATVSVLVNGEAAPTTAKSIFSGKGPAPTSGAEMNGLISDSTAKPALADRMWGSVSLMGDVAQMLVDFQGRSSLRSAFEIGSVKSLILQITDDEVRAALKSLSVRLADGSTLDIEAPLASATYVCGAGKCVIDATSKSLQQSSNALPSDQQCLMSSKFAELALPRDTTKPMEVDEPDAVSAAGGLGSLEIGLIAAGSAALLIIIVVGGVCIVKRRRGWGEAQRA